ncbi:DUF6602 domain-containing protein [Flavobacterium aquatile]|uniref:DUF6602 domain-containing protein n=1 Tax=Flavobacterium aquatile LMG 4008 = ATCC 11947 TaxID=1453498 RepID=A0A095TZA6_9FLAO|nr:DUF6602 domain-containing protein [Flavobacterium aquatile]KGD67708.1 hypothetical protein LG45_11345 [Flavobacterium aquatile LMG 4008 = ATCC 11947]OXA67571.1 hypothetical protein B0A61_07075 [Flavobacterium aquatile LMG 4008 = ATCC 11947]GEC78203.1 hypothetical protein FAQ01_10730 [Flavobacterium aquatile]
MANKIFEEILIEEIEIFINSFANVSKKMFESGTSKNKLLHSGEFGMYREAIVKRFLRFFIPQSIEIDQGFLINSFDDVSTQCDIVIYDRNHTPFIKSNELQRFFPVETVCAVGEVKSTLDFTSLKNACKKLYEVKKISEKVGSKSILRRFDSYPYGDVKCGNDLITTFIVCQKLDFNLDKLTSLYDSEDEPRFMHNVILSIEDGLILYSNEDEHGNNEMHIHPTWDKVKLNNLAVYSLETGGIDCFKIFCNLIFNATTFRTIVLPEILSYMKYPSN